MKTIREKNNTLHTVYSEVKVLKEKWTKKSCQPRILYPVKIFKYLGKINIFSDKWKLRGLSSLELHCI